MQTLEMVSLKKRRVCIVRKRMQARGVRPKVRVRVWAGVGGVWGKEEGQAPQLTGPSAAAQVDVREAARLARPRLCRVGDVTGCACATAMCARVARAHRCTPPRAHARCRRAELRRL